MAQTAKVSRTITINTVIAMVVNTETGCVENITREFTKLPMKKTATGTEISHDILLKRFNDSISKDYPEIRAVKVQDIVTINKVMEMTEETFLKYATESKRKPANATEEPAGVEKEN